MQFLSLDWNGCFCCHQRVRQSVRKSKEDRERRKRIAEIPPRPEKVRRRQRQLLLLLLYLDTYRRSCASILLQAYNSFRLFSRCCRRCVRAPSSSSSYRTAPISRQCFNVVCPSFFRCCCCRCCCCLLTLLSFQFPRVNGDNVDLSAAVATVDGRNRQQPRAVETTADTPKYLPHVSSLT